MKKVQIPGILILMICLLTNPAWSQSKYDKGVTKADALYDKGAYDKAKKQLDKLHTQTVKKLGAANAYIPAYYIREARLNLVLGEVSGLEESITNALKTSAEIYGASSEKHANTLLDVAGIYAIYGNFRLAREYADQAENVLKEVNLFNEINEGKVTLMKAEAMIGQGFGKEALELLQEKEKFYISRAVAKETTVVDGAIKSVTINSAELAERFNSYGRYLMLVASAYAAMGDFLAADPAFQTAQNWMKKNVAYLGDYSLLPDENNYRWRELLSTTLQKIPGELRNLEYDRMLGSIKQKSSALSASPLAQEIYIKYLNELQTAGNRARYANVKAEYGKILDKYFKKSSLVRKNMDAVEYSTKLNKDETKNLETRAGTLISSLPKTYKTTVKLNEFLLNVAIRERRYTNAETYLNELVTIEADLYGESSPKYHLRRIKLASFYLDYTNKLAEAATIFEESYNNVVAKEIHDWHPDHLDILSHLAQLYEYRDNYREATATLKKAATIASEKFAKDDVEYGITLDKIAQLQIKLGMYEEADQGIKTALPLLEAKVKNDPTYTEAYIHALETEARLYGIKGQYDDAQSSLNKTARIIKKSTVAIGNELSSKQELSALLIQLSKYSVVQDLLDDLIPTYQKTYGASSFRLIEPLVNQGNILLAKGDYAEAERVANRANKIAIDVYGEASTKAAPTQILLANIYYTIGDYEKAEINYTKAIQSQEKQFGRNHIDVAKSLSQLALVKFYSGDNVREIEPLMNEAKGIIENKLGNGNPYYADIMKNLAVLYLADNRYTEAFAALTIAEKIWLALAGGSGRKNNINTASIYTLTGDVYYQQRQYDKAEEFYNKSKALYERVFSKNHPEYVKVLSKLGKLYYMKKNYKQSKSMIEEALANYEIFIKEYFPALSEREKAKYWNTIKSDFEFYNTLAIGAKEEFKDLTDKVYNYQLLTKALLLNSSIKIRSRIMESDDEELKSQYNLWLLQKETLTLALSMTTEELIENEINPTAIHAEVERLEKAIGAKLDIFANSFEEKKITYQQVQQALGPNEVAIEIVRYRYFDHTFTDSIIYAALYVTPDRRSKPKAIVLGDGARMETRFFRYYRNAIISKIPDQVSYSIFWEPIQRELGQVSKVYLSADGVYNQINLEAIPTPDGKYIIDNSNIVLVSNSKDLVNRKAQQAGTNQSKTASMFGNPTFYLSASTGRNISPLPGTEKEVSQLNFILKEQGWSTSEYVEQSASEDKIKELNSPKIFHIATHGFYKPSEEITLEKEIRSSEATLARNPLLRTGLLLTGAGDLLQKSDVNYNAENGILTAYEAMNLNLDKTDLVVLSACETGLGEVQAGEGVYGLQRAFLVAGARILIMSMFKVDDEATQKLMLKFYQKWLASGNMRDSFTAAKKELRAEYPEPIYWGAFMMIGLE